VFAVAAAVLGAALLRNQRAAHGEAGVTAHDAQAALEAA
jgi:hypothetical protein